MQQITTIGLDLAKQFFHVPLYAVVINGAIRECAVAIARHPEQLPDLLSALTSVVGAISKNNTRLNVRLGTG